MARSAVAVVVGFTRRPGLLSKSFETLRNLRRARVLDRILYVTWDRPDLDEWVADAEAMREVDVVRIPEPKVQGLGYQKKHFYQTRNIVSALEMIPDDDTLVLKIRPDQVVDANFLAQKILSFDYCCAPSQLRKRIIQQMPRSPFRMKVWTPWADSNQPFFMEDGIFAALREDAMKLLTPASDEIVRKFGDERSLWITNVARYIEPFRADYPIFERYLQVFHQFVQNDAIRAQQLNATVMDPFFWHLAVANAWILADNFHIDAGHNGQIVFYPPEGADDPHTGKHFSEIPSRPPFTTTDRWRAGQQPGSLTASMRRLYGRLMDDNWQHAIFDAPLSDLTPENLTGILERVVNYRSGVLNEVEAAYYAKLDRIYREHFPSRSAA